MLEYWFKVFVKADSNFRQLGDFNSAVYSILLKIFEGKKDLKLEETLQDGIQRCFWSLVTVKKWND